jgi:tetratricopeptide (TPR) repeat protein
MTTPLPPGSMQVQPRSLKLPSWLLRLILFIGVPLAFFGLLEGTLRLVGFGSNLAFFIPDEDQPGYYCANPEFTELFLPAHFGIRPLNFRFTKNKAPRSLRVFVLGESAAQGTPEPGFGFAAQLQAQLAAHYGDRKVEVLNLGITAINSHVVYQVARHLPEFEPDLFVVYMGNNEVIGPYGPGSAYLATMPPLWAIRASVWARGTRTGQLLLRLLPQFGGGGAKAPEWRGMETFAQNTVRGSDPRLEAVYANFERNLRGILAVAARAGGKTVLATVVANLKDSSPFVSLHRANLTPTELAAWQTAFAAGTLAWQLEEFDRAHEQFTAALKIDGEYADTHFMLGRLEETRGNLDRARQHFLDALHWDALRFRPDPRLNDIIRQVAREAGPSVQLVDAARILGSDAASTAPLCGRDLLFEHVHFNWEGNFRLSTLLAEACAIVLPDRPTTSKWLSDADAAAALGYTDYGRLTMLGTIAELTGKPPFTNQLTFGEYQTQLQGETARLRPQVMSRDGLLAAQTQVAAALQRNPQEPGLMIRLQNIEFDLKNFDRALELVEAAMKLQPRSAVLVTQKANLLNQFNRPNEAEELLLNSTQVDPYYFPAWQLLVSIWARTGQVAKGQLILEPLLQKMPGNNFLRMAYATLLFRGGAAGPAEQELRTILRNDPSNTTALEQLVGVCQQAGRSAEVEALMREYAPFQPRNSANNTRLAQSYAALGDVDNFVASLRLLAESGPADASLLLELAQRLLDLNQPGEALVYARRGQRAAVAENNAGLRQAADDILARLKQF